MLSPLAELVGSLYRKIRERLFTGYGHGSDVTRDFQDVYIVIFVLRRVFFLSFSLLYSDRFFWEVDIYHSVSFDPLQQCNSKLSHCKIFGFLFLHNNHWCIF